MLREFGADQTMTMISYAQNHEDVLLQRVFPECEDGFYIDVGASDPIVDSVTKHFYDRGWPASTSSPIAALTSSSVPGDLMTST